MTAQEKIFKKIFGVEAPKILNFNLDFTLLDSETIGIVYEDLYRNLIFNDETFDLYDEDGEIIGNVKDFEIFESFKEFNECPDCYGEGYYEDDISGQCTKYIGDCCGGCTASVKCECENKPFNF